MSSLPWVLGGSALALGAYAISREKRNGVTDNDLTGNGAALPGRWVWPVPVWMGRRPEVSDGFDGKRRSSSGEWIRHGGVDIMYRRIATDPYRARSSNGSPGFVMPDSRAALAASDGLVWSARKTARGGTVVIDHSPRLLATYYTHMSELLVVPKQLVRAGQPIGVIGADPLDGAHLMHLHFETWRGGPKDRFDPEPLMLAWEYLPDPGDMPRMLWDRADSTRRSRHQHERNADVRTGIRRRGRQHPRSCGWAPRSDAIGVLC